MVNDLLSNSSARVKYVDDLSVLEIMPRNSPSILKHLGPDIQDFADSNNMRLNPIKRKELSVTFSTTIVACVSSLQSGVSKSCASIHSSFSVYTYRMT